MTHGQIAGILAELGFEKRHISESHVVYTRDETLFLFPIARPSEKVLATQISWTRFLLDARGIANAQRWKTLVTKHR